MKKWELIRLRCVRDKEPIKRVARELECSENTVRKYIRTQTPPTKMTMARASVFTPYQAIIDDYIRTTPKITARRIGALLREKHGLQRRPNERTIREYVAKRRSLISIPEAFIRAEYAPGDQAQFDFSPMRVILDCVECVVQLFVMRLSYSGHFFCRASYRQDRPALFKGILDAVIFFGGLPHVAVFDNAKTAVDKIKSGRARIENEEFQAFRGELALEVQFAAPARGNEKGGVEGMNGYIEDNFFRPMPQFKCMDDLNAALCLFAERELQRIHSTHKETVANRFMREASLLCPLPDRLPRPIISVIAKVNKFAEVTVDTNRYSVPSKFAYRTATVEISDASVVILIGGEMAATHARLNVKNGAAINVLHSLELLSKKHRAASRAFALAHDRLPDALRRLFTRLNADDESCATRKWTRVLHLATEYPLEVVAQAAEVALSRGTIDPDAIALIVRQRRDVREKVQFTHETATGRHAQPVTLDSYCMASLVEYAS